MLKKWASFNMKVFAGVEILETDRQTHTETDRQRETHVQTDIHTDGHTDMEYADPFLKE